MTRLTSVRHAEQASLRVLDLEVLIRELLSVDAQAASAIAAGEIATLDHEVLDDAVEGASLVGQRLAASPDLVPLAEVQEVVGGARRGVPIEHEGDATCVAVSNRNIKVHLDMYV